MTDLVSGWTEFAATHGGRLLTILLIAFLLNRVLRSLTRRLVKVAEQGSPSRLERLHEQHTHAVAAVLYRAGTALILLVAVLTALPEFGFNIIPVVAVAGLASLALGFGAQHLIRDFINGFLILFEGHYLEGDTVRISDVLGRVEHLTLRRTVLRDVQRAVVSIPNGEIGKVANLSRDWTQLFLDIIVAADKPLDAAFSALGAVASEFRADPAWSPMLIDGPRVLGVESLGPDGVTLRLRARTAPNRQEDVARELRRRIQARLVQQGIHSGGVHRVRVVDWDPGVIPPPPKKSI